LGDLIEGEESAWCVDISKREAVLGRERLSRLWIGLGRVRRRGTRHPCMDYHNSAREKKSFFVTQLGAGWAFVNSAKAVFLVFLPIHLSRGPNFGLEP
jgi:hypothetical protein